MLVIPSFLFFNDTATTEIYTLSLHDALPICPHRLPFAVRLAARGPERARADAVERALFADEGAVERDGLGRDAQGLLQRSEEHTSELQSRQYLVCRLLLEKKKKKDKIYSDET